MVWELQSEDSLVDCGTSFCLLLLVLESMCVICVYVRTTS